MSFSPYNLRVNYVKSPYAVVEDMNPVFTWAVKGAKSAGFAVYAILDENENEGYTFCACIPHFFIFCRAGANRAL